MGGSSGGGGMCIRVCVHLQVCCSSAPWYLRYPARILATLQSLLPDGWCIMLHAACFSAMLLRCSHAAPCHACSHACDACRSFCYLLEQSSSAALSHPLLTPCCRIHRYSRRQLRSLPAQLPYHVRCCNSGVPVSEASCSLPSSAFSLAAQVRRGFSFNYYNRHFLPEYMQVGAVCVRGEVGTV